MENSNAKKSENLSFGNEDYEVPAYLREGK